MEKAVSNENLARFLEKCDERYAKIGVTQGTDGLDALTYSDICTLTSVPSWSQKYRFDRSKFNRPLEYHDIFICPSVYTADGVTRTWLVVFEVIEPLLNSDCSIKAFVETTGAKGEKGDKGDPGEGGGGTQLYRHVVTMPDTEQIICFISTSDIQITELSQINPEDIISFVYYTDSATPGEKNPVVVYNFMPGGTETLYICYISYGETSSNPDFNGVEIDIYLPATDSTISTFSLTRKSRFERSVVDIVTKM